MVDFVVFVVHNLGNYNADAGSSGVLNFENIFIGCLPVMIKRSIMVGSALGRSEKQWAFGIVWEFMIKIGQAGKI